MPCVARTQVQQLVWTEDAAGTSSTLRQQWTCATWRRGSVPLWWKTEVKSPVQLGLARRAEALPGESRWLWQVSEPELVIRQDPCNGCELFFAKMRKRCALAPNEL